MKRKQQPKTTYPKKKQGTQHDANTNCTIVSHNINHDTNIPSRSTSNIYNIQLDETPVHTETEVSLSSNEEGVEAHVQTQKNTRKQYRKTQTTEWRIEQMCQYREKKQPQQLTQLNDAQRLPIARQNLEVLMRQQSMAMMWEIWTTFVLHVEH